MHVVHGQREGEEVRACACLPHLMQLMRGAMYSEHDSARKSPPFQDVEQTKRCLAFIEIGLLAVCTAIHTAKKQPTERQTFFPDYDVFNETLVASGQVQGSPVTYRHYAIVIRDRCSCARAGRQGERGAYEMTSLLTLLSVIRS